MPPPGYEPFLNAICAEPDDDTPRLVYADWLDENGDPKRAEFIRCQIEVARTGNRKSDAHRRAQKLKHSHEGKWLNELPLLLDFGWREFRRGFISGISMTGDAPALALSRACPLAPIQDVTVGVCSPNVLCEIANSPYLKNLASIEAPVGAVNDDSVCLLADTPAASRLESLTLSGSWWEPGPAGSGYIPRITDRGLLALCRSPHLKRLRQLTLYTAHISDAAFEEAQSRLPFVCFTRQPSPT